MHTLADGCCSAVTPCSWQRDNPSTICDTCRASSLSVAAYLKVEAVNARKCEAEYPSDHPNGIWHCARAGAYEDAHAYAVARPERLVAPTHQQPVALSVATSDADLAYLAGIAISSKDATLARIAAALLLAR